MSHSEKENEQTQEQEAPNKGTDDSPDEIRIVEAMKPTSAPSAGKPLRYGTRRGRPGAQPAPAVTQLNSISAFEEEEIEMDDLPVKANAPEHLIDQRTNPSEDRRPDREDRPRRERRSRGEQRRPQRRERAPETEDETQPNSEATETEAAVATESSQSAASEENRPPRFGMVSDQEGAARAQSPAKEFRPSRDGRVSERRGKSGTPNARSKPAAGGKKKGFLSKVIAFFTGDEAEKHEEKSARGPAPAKRGRRDTGRQDREDGEGKPRRKRRPRNRNRERKPGQQGEGNENRPEGQSGEGGKRRRRPRRRGQRRGNGDRQQGARDTRNTPSS